MVDELGEASKEYVAQGITTNTEAGIGLFIGQEEFEVHVKAAEQRINPMRTQLMIMHFLLRKGEVFGNYSPAQLSKEIKERSTGLAKLDSTKMSQYVSIQGLKGAVRKPYHNEPGDS